MYPDQNWTKILDLDSNLIYLECISLVKRFEFIIAVYFNLIVDKFEIHQKAFVVNYTMDLDLLFSY